MLSYNHWRITTSKMTEWIWFSGPDDSAWCVRETVAHENSLSELQNWSLCMDCDIWTPGHRCPKHPYHLPHTTQSKHTRYCGVIKIKLSFQRTFEHILWFSNEKYWFWSPKCYTFYLICHSCTRLFIISDCLCVCDYFCIKHFYKWF